MRVRPAIARTDCPPSGQPPGSDRLPGSTRIEAARIGATRTDRARGRSVTDAAPRRRPRIGVPAAMTMLVAALALAGCASQRPDRSGLFEPYRTDLPQGNYLTKEMLDQVRTGMSREQVRAVLGAPLLLPVFRNDRWDYVFRYRHASGKVDSRRVTVRFNDDRVEKIEADALPEREDLNDPALPGARPRSPNS